MAENTFFLPSAVHVDILFKIAYKLFDAVCGGFYTVLRFIVIALTFLYTDLYVEYIATSQLS